MIRTGALTRTLAIGLAFALPGQALAQETPATVLSDVEASRYRAPVGETFLVERAELSPDGRQVAYVAALANSQRLRVQSLDGGVSRTADLRGLDVRDIVWAGDDHVLVTVLDQPSDEVAEENGVFLVLSYAVKSDSWETLLRDRGDQVNVGGLRATRLPGQPPVLPITFERPAVRQREGKAQVFLDTITFNGSCRYDLYSVDPGTGASLLEDRMTQQVQGLVVGPDGRPAAVLKDGRLRMGRGAGLVNARARELSGDIELLGLGREPGSVLVRAGPDAARRLLEISGARGEIAVELPTEGLAQPWPLYDDHSGRLLGVEGVGENGRVAYRFFDAKLESAWRDVAGAFPGDAIRLASWSSDLTRLLIYAERTDGADYHLVDLAVGVSRLMAPSWPEPAREGLDRTGSRAEFDIRRAAAARIEDPRRLCQDLRGAGATESRGGRSRTPGH